MAHSLANISLTIVYKPRQAHSINRINIPPSFDPFILHETESKMADPLAHLEGDNNGACDTYGRYRQTLYQTSGSVPASLHVS